MKIVHGFRKSMGRVLAMAGECSNSPRPIGRGAWGTDIVPGVPVKKPLAPNGFYHIRIELKRKTATLFASFTPEAKNL
ncbi:hypothetical protein IH992_14665, partial [Candidatus Poribacteria bacterium]|nr:hypothetical protein [Candidatus Poribacteria bacterium]